MHRIGRVSLCLLVAAGAAACAGGTAALEAPPATPQQGLDRLLKEGLFRSQQRLQAKYLFLPFALRLGKDGSVDMLGGRSGDIFDAQTSDTPEQNPAKLLAGLQQQVAKQAKTGRDIVAVGFFSDAQVKLPNGGDSEAIQADLEHSSGLCETVFEPYDWISDQSLSFGQQIRSPREGAGAVFSCR